MIAPMYPYQSAAAADIVAGKQVYLGFDPGLGKSRTALDAAQRRKVKRLLVICPASGRYVWESEAKKWASGMPFHMVTGIKDLGKLKNDGIVVITYGLLSIRDSAFVAMITKGAPFDMTILDEAAAVKNSGANRTRSILTKMLPKLGYLLPMSGTPAPNHAGELFPILRAIYPQALTLGGAPGRIMNEHEFQDHFCKVVNKSFGTAKQIRVIEGSKNLPELRQRMNGFMLRVKKEDVLKDLPPIRWDVVPVDADLANMPPVPMLGSVALDALNAGDDETFMKYLAGATGEEHVMRLRRILGLAKVSAAVGYLQDFMDGLPAHKNQKILVFAHHREVIAMLEAGLASHSPVVITGASTPTERSNAVNDFLSLGRHRVMVANIAAAGTGLTLVGPYCKCSDVFFVEASYSVGDNVQAASRVHRIGQSDAVIARMLTAHGTIDDRIQSILARKAQDFNQLFN